VISAAERMRLKISGEMIVLSGTISWTRTRTNSTASAARNDSAVPT
jgi:hypothetical protein